MTEETQAKYLSVLRCCGHMGYAALQAAVSAYAVKKERGSNPDFDNAVSFYYWRMKLLDGICSVADGRAASEASHSFPDFATARYQRAGLLPHGYALQMPVAAVSPSKGWQIRLQPPSPFLEFYLTK